MLRVITKCATYVESLWLGAGEEIEIAEHHFSPEVHELVVKTKAAESEPAESEPAELVALASQADRAREISS